MSSIVIFAYGTRGDVQPPVNLGAELRGRGHTVRVLTSERYRGLVTGAGLELAPMQVDPVAVLASPEGQRLHGGPIAFLTGFRRLVRPLMDQMLADAASAGQGADLILAPVLGGAGAHVAQAVGAASLVYQLQPCQMTAAFADPVLAQGRDLGPVLNRASHAALERITWSIFGPSIRPWRQHQLGLPPLPRRKLGRWLQSVSSGPSLGAFSPSVVPPPVEWAGVMTTTGFWFDQSVPEPSPELSRFMDAGPAPVYVGFGSMVPADARATAQAAAQALAGMGRRGVLLRPGASVDGQDGVPDDLGAHMLVLDEAPHAWLFPRCAAVVHHGGAGTTAAAARAGVPQVICPVTSDQRFWARALRRQGAAAPALPLAGLTAPLLEQRLRSVLESGSQVAAARVLATRIAHENGVQDAADAAEIALDQRRAGLGGQVPAMRPPAPG